MAKATWRGVVLAESDDIEVVEGNRYFPRSSLRPEYFRASEERTACFWKGTANYFDVIVDGERNEMAAWTYPDPTPAAERIRGRVAFWNGVTVAD